MYPSELIQTPWTVFGPAQLTVGQLNELVRTLARTLPGLADQRAEPEAGVSRWWFTSKHPGLSTTLWLRMEDGQPVEYAIAGTDRMVAVEQQRWSRVISGTYRAFRHGASHEVLSPHLRLGSEGESTSLVWTESMGGPLVVLPNSKAHDWTGFEIPRDVDSSEAVSDYEKAVAMSRNYGTLPFGRSGSVALVLRDPWATTYISTLNAFVQWIGADSEGEVVSAAETVATDRSFEWEEFGSWRLDESAVIMDSFFTMSQRKQANAAGFLPGPTSIDPVRGLFSLRAGQWRLDLDAGEPTTIGMLQLGH